MDPDFFFKISEYNIRRARPDPARCALLIIDMQEYFRSVASPVIPNVLSIAGICHSRGMKVIFTRHGHEDGLRDGGMLAEWWGDLVLKNSGGWAILHEFQPENDDAIIDKKRYNAFHGTGLNGKLKRYNIDQLIITGVLTNCCCETTAREAFVRDYRVFFVSDATATVNNDLHLSSLKNLAFGFAHVVSTRQIHRYLDEYQKTQHQA